MWTSEKLPRHFKAIFQQSRKLKIKKLPTLILVLYVEAGLNKMFEVEKEEVEVKQCDWNECEKFRKLTRHFKSLSQQSHSFDINYLPTIIQVLNV